MARWEEEALKTARKQPLVYFRFLGDVFILWTHSEKDFWEFFEVLKIWVLTVDNQDVKGYARTEAISEFTPSWVGKSLRYKWI